MEHRMSLRIPTDQPATLTKRPERLLRKLVRVHLNGRSAPSAAPPEIAAHVVRVETDGLGSAFDSYDEAVNDYLERVCAERLKREPTSLSLWR